MIPKNIYFFFDDGLDLMHQVLKDNIEFVKNQNPLYNVILYDTKKVNDYLKKKNSTYYRIFNLLNPKFANLLANYFRYVILYEEGGVYLDIKSRPNKPIDEIINQNSKLWLCFASAKELDIQSCFMMSEKNSIYFKKVIEVFNCNVGIYNSLKINIDSPKKNCLKLFGTYMLADMVREQKKNIEFSNSEYILVKSRYWRKFGVFSCYKNLSSNRIFSSKHYDLYNKPAYRTVKEHLIKSS